MRVRPKGRFHENLVCIVLIIGSELDVMKKSLTTRESTYIELIFRKKRSASQAKGLCQKRQSEKCPESSKNGQDRDFEPHFHAN